MNRLGWPNKLALGLSAAASMLMALLYFMPWAPEFPKEDLEHSWQLGLNYATAQGMHFGSELVFTFGPFSAAHTRGYYPGTFTWALVVTAGLGVFLVGCAIRSAQRSLGGAVFILVWGLLISLISSLYLKDALFLIAPFFVFLSIQDDYKLGRRMSLWTIFGVVVLAMISLVKTTFAIASIATLVFVVLLPSSLVLRLLPATMYALSVAALWLLSGQPLSALVLHARTTLPIVNGYTEAMSIAGIWNPMALYVIGACLALGMSIRRYRLLASISLAATLFFAFKAAYVRQDIHEVIAAGVLALVAVWFASPKLDSRSIVMLMAALSLCSYSLSQQVGLNGQRFAVEWFSQGQRSFQGLSDLARNRNVLQDRFQERLHLLSQQYPLPHMDGTADSYSLHQTALIASGAAWNPRPVLQSYSAYNGELARMNAEHLSKVNRPDTLVFQIEPIDARLPAMDDGLSWPEIWSRYSLRGNTQVGLLFSAAPQGTPTYESAASIVANMGEEISIPHEPGTLVWAKIKIQKTLLGRIANLFFRTPALRISIEDQQGRRRIFRYIPAVGEAGFLLSPLVGSTADFERITRQLSGGDLVTGSIRRFRIEQDDSPFAAYAAKFTIETSLLSIQKQATPAGEPRQ